MMQKRVEQGFTLIELMIAIIVVGILAAIALPSYQGHVRKSACEDTKAVITGAANVMERIKAQSNTYSGADLGAYVKAPVDGGNKHADIAITASTSSSYTLTATGAGLLAGKGTLTLTSTGARSGTGALANAWVSCNGI